MYIFIFTMIFLEKYWKWI